MTVDRRLLFQLFKYTVYALLALNIYLFFDEESAAAALQFRDGVGLHNVIEAFSATIDTAAWVVLLLMFELETYVLDDAQVTNPVKWSLHGLRAFCYALIVWAFVGYVENLVFLYEAVPLAGISNICALLPGSWSWAETLDQYAAITSANCATLSPAAAFFQFNDMAAIVDAEGLKDIRRLAWVDVINAAVWLLVVLVLEIDVRLQEHERFEGLAFRLSSAAKFVLYSVLLLAAIYWGFKGDFVDFWDAFLWLVAFVFIELNVVEWREEDNEEMAKTTLKRS